MQLSLLVLKTNQPESVRNFYEGLGLQFRKERHGHGPVHYAAEAGNVLFEIYPLPPSAAKADTSNRVGFRVEALDPIIAGMEAAGVTVVVGPQRTEWGYRAVVKDPDGRCVELIQAPD